MKSKLKLIVPIVLVASLGGYKFGFAKEAPKAPTPKVHGDVCVLGKDFRIKLDGGSFAKVSVALLVKPGTAAPPASSHGASPEPRRLRNVAAGGPGARRHHRRAHRCERERTDLTQLASRAEEADRRSGQKRSDVQARTGT